MIDEVIDRLAQNRLVLIHGVSGSGKSSLVRAGVLPKLALQYQRHDAPWLTCAMRPSGGPLWNLAAEFARLEERAGDAERIGDIAGQFNARSATLASIAGSLEGIQGKSICMLIDQFEELFRFEREMGRDEAELFVDLIAKVDTAEQSEAALGVDFHVIVTMRSEFLGECARFAGFAETINRTQYLVPRMDDSGLMRAVRGPAQGYGAVFDLVLAQRLVGSVRGREDELPLLQHGLALMWDDALRRAGSTELMAMEGTVVDEAGGLGNLLSQHADQVMGSVAPDDRSKRIVESVFRALTDVTSEGAAIRRPCAFGNLCAVAGATPAEVRPILDAFRAPGVSFLTPYAPEPIDEKRPIDVSHEALIRSWREIGAGANGWLLKEFRDGVAWRTLLLQAENFAEDKSFFLSEATTETRVSWLDERNEAWSQRYGGGWPKVVALVEASREHWRLQHEAAAALEAKRRSSRTRRWIATVVVSGIVTLAGGLWVYYEKVQRQLQENLDRSAMTPAKTLLEHVLQAYNDKSLDLAGARSFADISGQLLHEARASRKTSAADLIWGQALNDESDLYAILGNNTQSLAVAKQAKDVAQSLIRSNSSDGMQLLFDASIRAGNALWALPGRRQEAMQEYNDAVRIATTIASSSGDRGDVDLIDAHLKIGDVYKEGDAKQHQQALAEYQSGLKASEAALSKRPNDLDLLRNKGKAFYRIAEFLRDDNALNDARAYYQKAIEVQNGLVSRKANDQGSKDPHAPEDLSLKSNLASTYIHWGLLEQRAGNFEVALAKLRQGVALNEELAKNEPGNPQWQEFLTPNYLYLAQTLEGLKRPDEALTYYRKLNDARRMLAYRAPGRSKPQKDLADAARQLGDRSTGIAQIEAYREAVRSWNRLVDDSRSADAAAEQYDVVLGFARTFDAKKDWPDAESAYRVAMKIAVLNYTKNSWDTSWRDKAEEAERAAIVAGKAAESIPLEGTR